MAKNPNRVSTEEAAKRMGVSPSYVRMGIRSGRLPFGTAVHTGNKNWTYHIVRAAFERYLEEGMGVERGKPCATVYSQNATQI